jgi:hypothetical protein
MLVDTMMPEAFEQAHDFAGLVTVFGFLSAYLQIKSSAIIFKMVAELKFTRYLVMTNYKGKNYLLLNLNIATINETAPIMINKTASQVA